MRLRLGFADCSDLPDERPIPDLPIERPDFALLFGKNADVGSPTAKEIIGLANGSANGHANGQANGIINGHANGHARRIEQRTQRGGADIDITDKFTMTWVGSDSPLAVAANASAWPIDFLRYSRQARHFDGSRTPRPHYPFSSRPTAPPSCTLYPRRAEESGSRSRLPQVRLHLCSIAALFTTDCSHYDHLDPEAVKELGDSCEWVVPRGAGQFLRDLGVSRVTELEWVRWEESR